MRSLEKQVVVGLTLLLAAALTVLLLISAYAVKHMGESYVLTRLEHDAEALLAAVGKKPSGQVHLRQGRITPIYLQPYSGHYYQIVFADGLQLNSRSVWDKTFQTRRVASGDVATYFTRGPDKQHLLVRSAGYEKSGLKFTLSVAEDMTPLTSDIRYFQINAFIILGIAALVIILTQRYILRKGFRELDNVRDEIQQVSSGQIKTLSEMGPSEIRPVTIAVNRLLKQLQQRLRRSRDALGNLAHALKSPISLMTNDIEHLSVEASVRDRLATQLSRIRELIDRELKRARLAGRDAGQYFNPAKDMADLVAALKQIHRDRHIKIVMNDLPDTNLPFDQEDMLELLGNLMDNACKWATGKVIVDTRLENALCFTISDDGAGVSETEMKRMVGRGVRIDENKSGHGLGLAIVQDIITDYAGSIEYAVSSELGGLQVSVILPFPRFLPEDPAA